MQPEAPSECRPGGAVQIPGGAKFSPIIPPSDGSVEKVHWDEGFHRSPLQLQWIRIFEHLRPCRIGVQHNAALNHGQTSREGLDGGKEDGQIGRSRTFRSQLRNRWDEKVDPRSRMALSYR